MQVLNIIAETVCYWLPTNKDNRDYAYYRKLSKPYSTYTFQQLDSALIFQETALRFRSIVSLVSIGLVLPLVFVLIGHMWRWLPAPTWNWNDKLSLTACMAVLLLTFIAALASWITSSYRRIRIIQEMKQKQVTINKDEKR